MRARSLAACARLCQGNQLGRAQRTQSALKTLLRDSQPPTAALSVHATLTGRDGRKGQAAPTCHARQPSCQQAPGVFGSAGPAGPSLASLNTEVACGRRVSAAGTPRPRPRLKRNGPGYYPDVGPRNCRGFPRPGSSRWNPGRVTLRSLRVSVTFGCHPPTRGSRQTPGPGPGPTAPAGSPRQATPVSLPTR